MRPLQTERSSPTPSWLLLADSPSAETHQDGCLDGPDGEPFPPSPQLTAQIAVQNGFEGVQNLCHTLADPAAGNLPWTRDRKS